MIPSIHDILTMLLDGSCTKLQAEQWIAQHMENQDLLDGFAMAALQGMLCNGFMPKGHDPDGEFDYTAAAYSIARDALIERAK